MRRVQRRRRNPGAGVVLGTLAVTGGVAALVALAYQRKKPPGATRKTLEAAWAARDAALEQANKARLQEAREEQDALDAIQQAARDEAAARDAWRNDPRQELAPAFVDLSTKAGRRGECESVAANRWSSPFGRASAATCAASADPQVDAELRATGWKPGYAPPRDWVPPWGAQTEPANEGVAPDVKVLSGLGGVLDGRDFGAYGRPMGKLLVRALWGVGLGIVGTGLGTSLVSALVTKPFGRFWGTTAGFATYTSGLGIVAYLAAGYAKEGLVLAGKAAGEALDKGDAPALPKPAAAPAAPVSGYRGSYVWG